VGENSRIEWCDSTFNPWVGCTKVSRGCDHCYAEAMMDHRYGKLEWGPHGARKRTSEANWKKPLQWAKQARASGTRPRVFCASLADVFDNKVPDEWRFDLGQLILATPELDWLLLTKRPENMTKGMLPVIGWPWPNVWLGVTAEDQARADHRIPILLNTPAAVRFVSYEPALGPIEFGKWADEGVYIDWLRGFDGSEPPTPGLDWVIAGGESGPNARPAHPQWFRDVRDQCKAAGVAFHYKQAGEWMPVASARSGEGGALPPDRLPQGVREVVVGDVVMRRVGKKAAGRLLDGIEHNGFPGMTTYPTEMSQLRNE
jgi:protein gp37